MSRVAIIMGSISDYEVMRNAEEVLKRFQIDFETDVVSAHRTPQKMFQFAKSAEEKGFKVIIAAAGGAAHLPGMVASISNLPVIGVPIKGKTMDGLDSLLSIVQMPKGIPVATVAINGAANAAVLATQILALSDDELKEKIKDYKMQLEKDVDNMSKKLKEESHANI
ncbi:N5-carboxyaminoimidazole ribonucleotide mutase [Caloramator mitchellensis]|uniref:N5-carboxyaminoimidazole ribonucleotide mutase n=1 Tax=Caloramator mitchellensis TaxID=908809 RepID=A0A0R3JRX6_CALMK|nr:5-(carboxyamino)imidazole ribonucleotide mutase [Caloramator mitchellensis]KRQ86246.1 N5-carboxyaminoimidazole ribonucleotide mutase [Caloramator mitchellensis]